MRQTKPRPIRTAVVMAAPWSAVDDPVCLKCGIPDHASGSRVTAIERSLKESNQVKRVWVLVLVAFLLSLTGAIVSGKLLAMHAAGAGSGGWLDSLCEGSSGAFNCDVVLNSRWGTFPPRAEGEEMSATGVPTALLGFGYFALMSAWFVLIGQPSTSRRKWCLFPLAMNAVGLAGSLGFLGIMATQLKVWCPLCITVHVANVLLFVVNVFLFRARGAKAQETGKVKQPQAMAPHPTWRLITACIALTFLATRQGHQHGVVATLTRENDKLTAVADEVQNSIETMMATFLDRERLDVSIRPDDPIRYDRPGIPTLVLWTDFECEHCKRFLNFAERQLVDMFDGDIRFAFKHFPTNEDCNRYIKGKPHPNACMAAVFAEGARKLGGNDKFWEAHDLLFSVQKDFAKLSVDDMSRRIGYAPDQLMAAMQSPEVSKRIFDDIQQAIQLGVTATPAMFLDGKRIGELARNVPGFWRELGRVYQVHRQEREGRS